MKIFRLGGQLTTYQEGLISIVEEGKEYESILMGNITLTLLFLVTNIKV